MSRLLLAEVVWVAILLTWKCTFWWLMNLHIHDVSVNFRSDGSVLVIFKSYITASNGLCMSNASMREIVTGAQSPPLNWGWEPGSNGCNSNVLDVPLARPILNGSGNLTRWFTILRCARSRGVDLQQSDLSTTKGFCKNPLNLVTASVCSYLTKMKHL